MLFTKIRNNSFTCCLRWFNENLFCVSLNDQLLVGPTEYAPLNDVLIRFRKQLYVLTTDVSKMYRAVGLAVEDRDYHRFLVPSPCQRQRSKISSRCQSGEGVILRERRFTFRADRTTSHLVTMPTSRSLRLGRI